MMIFLGKKISQLSFSIGLILLSVTINQAHGDVILSPYDPDIAQAVQRLSDSTLIRSDDPSSNIWATITWDFSRQAVLLNSDGSKRESREYPFENKPHLKKRVEDSDERASVFNDEKDSTLDATSSRVTNAASHQTKPHLAKKAKEQSEQEKMDQLVKDNQPRSMRLQPYQTKPHRMRQLEKRAVQNPTKSQQKRIEKLENYNKYAGDAGKMYPKPSLTIDTDPTNPNRYSIKKTRVSSSKPKQPSQSSIVSVSELDQPRMSTWQGSHEAKRQRARTQATVVSAPYWERPQIQDSVKERKNIFKKIGDAFKSEDEEGEEESRGIVGTIANVLTAPIKILDTETVYRLSSTLKIRRSDGSIITLPLIKTKDDQEMIDIFCRMTAQTLVWSREGKRDLIVQLSEMDTIETIGALNFRISELSKQAAK